MTTDRPVLQVLVASTRPGRVGEPTARWVAERAREYATFEVEIVDLAEIDLPMFAEPKHPRLGEYELAHTREFSATISRADGFVFVFPEYNHSYNAALKNAGPPQPGVGGEARRARELRGCGGGVHAPRSPSNPFSSRSACGP